MSLALGVSRVTLREALLALASGGLLTHRRQADLLAGLEFPGQEHVAQALGDGRHAADNAKMTAVQRARDSASAGCYSERETYSEHFVTEESVAILSMIRGGVLDRRRPDRRAGAGWRDRRDQAARGGPAAMIPFVIPAGSARI